MDQKKSGEVSDMDQKRVGEAEVVSPASSASPTSIPYKEGSHTYASSDATTSSPALTVSTSGYASPCNEQQAKHQQQQQQPLPVAAKRDVSQGQGIPQGGDQKQQPRQVENLTEETNTSFGVPGSMYDMEDMLGEGSFGAVYRCCLRQDDAGSSQGKPSSFAVKVMDANRLALLTGYPVELLCPRLRREVEILFHLGEQHPGVLRLYQAFFSQSSHKLYLVTELLQGGDLFKAIVARRKPFSEKEGRVIFSQIVDAMEFCHSMGVAHRDLKLENCLLVDKGSLKVKVCDFGQAKILSCDGLVETAQTLTTTPQYTAPEVASAVQAHQTYDAFKADAFGLGVMLYALLCCALPDAAKGEAYERHRHWSRLSPEAQSLIRTLLNPDPQQRPLPRDFKQHPWLAKKEPADMEVGSAVPSAMRTPDDLNSKMVVEALIGVQELVAALQRERGTACLALGGDEGESKLRWQQKCSVERQDVACQRIVNIMQSGGNPSPWVNLSTELCGLQKEIKTLRRDCDEKIEQREDCLDLEEDMREILSGYTALISRLIEALSGSFSLLGQGAPGGAPSLSVFKLRFLLFSGEQLARERGIVAGNLARSGSIRSAAVFRELAETIGARKALLGTTDNRAPLIGAGVSLATTLGIMEGSLLDGSDMASLEAVEDRAMGGKKVDLPSVAEWWHHLTKAVDKVHQHTMVSIVDHVAPGTPSSVGAL